MANSSVDSLYAISRTENEIQVPEYDRSQAYGAYTVDSGPEPHSNDGWAPTLEYVPGETPDPQRLGRDQVVDFRPNPRKSDTRFWGKLFKDRRSRESVVSVEPLPYTQQKRNSSPTRWAPNPRLAEIAEPRWTARLAPTTGGLTRPMNARTPKRNDGNHFSMADHARVDPEIFGMAPPRSPRSTYRLDTLPWGEEIVDVPVMPDYTPDEIIYVPSYAAAPSRSHRLV